MRRTSTQVHPPQRCKPLHFPCRSQQYWRCTIRNKRSDSSPECASEGSSGCVVALSYAAVRETVLLCSHRRFGCKTLAQHSIRCEGRKCKFILIKLNLYESYLVTSPPMRNGEATPPMPEN